MPTPAALWGFVRTCGVAGCLVGGLVWSFVSVALLGAGPTPQLPPEGYVVERGRVDLQWHRGTRPGAIRLQVAGKSGDFTRPIVDREEPGTTLSLKGLEPGRAYRWRLVQNGAASRVASFEISASHVDF